MKPLKSYFDMPQELVEHVSSLSREVEETIRAIQKAEYAAIENACRRAIQGGQYGVRVERVDGKLISVEVDPRVPYGQMHEHLHQSWVAAYTSDDLLCDLVKAYAAMDADRWYR